MSIDASRDPVFRFRLQRATLVFAAIFFVASCNDASSNRDDGAAPEADSVLRQIASVAPGNCAIDAAGAVPCDCLEVLAFENGSDGSMDQPMIDALIDVSMQAEKCVKQR